MRATGNYDVIVCDTCQAEEPFQTRPRANWFTGNVLRYLPDNEAVGWRWDACSVNCVERALRLAHDKAFSRPLSAAPNYRIS